MHRLIRKSDFATHQLTLWALLPRAAPVTREELARRLGISRTPLAEAIGRLASIGLVPAEGPVVSAFGGASDIALRARILGAAMDAGAGGTPRRGGACRSTRRIASAPASPADIVADAAGGRWAADTWTLLLLWPRCSARWGVPPGDHDARIDALVRTAREACARGAAGSAHDRAREAVATFATAYARYAEDWGRPPDRS